MKNDFIQKIEKKKIFIKNLNYFIQRANFRKESDFINELSLYLNLTRQAIYTWLRKEDIGLPSKKHLMNLLDFPILKLKYYEKEALWNIIFDTPYQPPSQYYSFSPIISRPILDPEYFFGRTLIIQKIINAWLICPMEHTIIIGQKNSGKTSLLYYLMNIQKIKHTIREDNSLIKQFNELKKDLIFVDFIDARFQEQHRFIQFFLNQIKPELNLDKNHTYDFVDFINEFSIFLKVNFDKKIILLFDNLDQQSKYFNPAFWKGIRALGVQHRNLAFCVTTREFSTKQITYSPFNNAFNKINLGALEEKEAEELLKYLSPKLSSDADKEWILKKSKRFPFFIQLCFKKYEENPINWQEMVEIELANYHNLI